MSKVIKAPFTPEEVDKLNNWQTLGYVHEYTCPTGIADPYHPSRVLVATVRGWICKYCPYTQDIAVDDMLNPPANPLEIMRRSKDDQAL
jgi:hypothetical protein